MQQAACKTYPLHGCGSGGSSGLRLHSAASCPSGPPQWGCPGSAPLPPPPQQQQQQHQPAPPTRCRGSKRRSSSPELLRCKRRLAFAGCGGGAAAVARRNERERNRVKLVNLGFQTLRQHVPHGAAAKKMSKVETLRSAVEYIRALQQLLAEHDAVGAVLQEGLLPPARGPPAAAAVTAACAGGGCSGSSYCSSASPSFDGREGSSVPGSPHSAYSSDESGYEGALSPEEQELLDFTSWFGGY